MSELAPLVEKWSRLALERGWVQRWAEGCIFPREMVWFLAICELNGVVNLIESGRQDGYSTELIGYFALERKGLAISVDSEADREIAWRCRQKLFANPHLVMIRGDIRSFLGPLLFADRQAPTAVLIDGPKGFLALSLLLAAAALPWVKVVAMHNLGMEGDSRDTRETREAFVSLGFGPHFYEERENRFGGAWQDLARAERDYCLGQKAARSLEQSSLGVLQVSRFSFRHLLKAGNGKFGRHQPLAFHLQFWLMKMLGKL
jgi:hypothetical protein